MLLSEVSRPFSHPGWGFELKYDGWRCLAELDNGTVRLQSRGGHSATRWWPEVVAALSPVPGHHILDGEMCVLDDLGRSDFDRLQARSMMKGWKPGADLVVYCVFDILLFEGRQVMDQPLGTRRVLLAELLKDVKLSVLPVGYIEQCGELLYKQAVALQLEGIVAKELTSLYFPGVRSPDWKKIKRPGAVPPERFKHAKRN